MSSKLSEPSQFTPDQLYSIVTSVKKMNKYRHIHIKELLENFGIPLNENINGIHINLTTLAPDIIEEILKYIKYTKDQDIQFRTNEDEKNAIKEEHFK